MTEHIPSFARPPQEHYCDRCLKYRPICGGRHSGNSFTCALCLRALEGEKQ